MNGLLSKKGFPLFKNYLKTLENISLTPEQRVEGLINQQNNLLANVNILTQRINNTMQWITMLKNTNTSSHIL